MRLEKLFETCVRGCLKPLSALSTATSEHRSAARGHAAGHQAFDGGSARHRPERGAQASLRACGHWRRLLPQIQGKAAGQGRGSGGGRGGCQDASGGGGRAGGREDRARRRAAGEAPGGTAAGASAHGGDGGAGGERTRRWGDREGGGVDCGFGEGPAGRAGWVGTGWGFGEGSGVGWGGAGVGGGDFGRRLLWRGRWLLRKPSSAPCLSCESAPN